MVFYGGQVPYLKCATIFSGPLLAAFLLSSFFQKKESPGSPLRLKDFATFGPRVRVSSDILYTVFSTTSSTGTTVQVLPALVLVLVLVLH